MKSLFQLGIFIGLSLVFFTFSSCEKDPIIETEIITVTDTIMINTIDTVLINSTDTVFVNTLDTVIVNTIDTVLIQSDEEVTTFILTRHAEILSDVDNPGLTEEGIARAGRLVEMLSVLELDRVYSTNFNRTRQTAMPVSDSQGVSLTTYGGFDHETVIDDILGNEKGGIVFIVGHGNTTPNFINSLTGTMDFPELAEDAFDNFYIVNTRSKGDSEVVHLKY